MKKYEYNCPSCYKSFDNEKDLIKHIKSHLEEYKMPIFSEFILNNNPKKVNKLDSDYFLITYKNIDFYIDQKDLTKEDFDFAIECFKNIKGLDLINFKLKEIIGLNNKESVENDNWEIARKIKFDTKYKNDIEFWLHSDSLKNLMIDALIEPSENEFKYDVENNRVYLELIEKV